jgi:hypothetical protein
LVRFQHNNPHIYTALEVLPPDPTYLQDWWHFIGLNHKTTKVCTNT